MRQYLHWASDFCTLLHYIKINRLANTEKQPKHQRHSKVFFKIVCFICPFLLAEKALMKLSGINEHFSDQDDSTRNSFSFLISPHFLLTFFLLTIALLCWFGVERQREIEGEKNSAGYLWNYNNIKLLLCRLRQQFSEKQNAFSLITQCKHNGSSNATDQVNCDHLHFESQRKSFS